jgi:transposase
LFIKLLDKLRKTYRCHKELHLATDNDGSHTSGWVDKYVQDSGGRIHLHPLPSWSPESNPVELVWWALHEAVSRNHECEDLDDLVEFAEGYLTMRGSPSIPNSARSMSSWRGHRLEVGECPFILWSYLGTDFRPSKQRNTQANDSQFQAVLTWAQDLAQPCTDSGFMQSSSGEAQPTGSDNTDSTQTQG